MAEDFARVGASLWRVHAAIACRRVGPPSQPLDGRHMVPMTGTPCRIGRLQGWHWRDPNPALLSRVPEWAESGPGAGCHELARGRVWAWGGVVAKRYAASSMVRAGLRRCAALRAASAALRMPAGTSPAPILAVRLPRGASMLVMDLVRGQSMRDCWANEPACVRALPHFLATLHGARQFHGDLHPGNLIWTGQSWVLIDLDGMRSPLRNILWRRQALMQWARLLRKLEWDPRLEGLFAEYSGAVRTGWDVTAAWTQVVRLAREIEAARQAGNPGG